MVPWCSWHNVHRGVWRSHGGPVPSHLACPRSHFTQSMRRMPRIGNRDVEWVPGKRDTLRRCKIHLRAGVGASPPHMAMSHGFVGS